MAPPTEAAGWAVEASPRVHELLRSLHAASEAQEKSPSQMFFYFRWLAGFYLWRTAWSRSNDDHMRDKFVSLEQDKCRFMYLVARSTGARNIVEAGTSFGVSTVYLALAVGQNVGAAGTGAGTGAAGKVIATEMEASKAARARRHWQQAGDEVEPWIELREGDVRETLREPGALPEQVDMLLLDIWTPMALPVLEIVRPRLRRGAVVLVDNTTMAKPLYKELLAYLHDAANGFKTTTTPYSGGFEMAVYLPPA